MADKSINCKTCGAVFQFTEEEQALYLEKGYAHEPTRCPDCRAATRKPNSPENNNTRGSYTSGEREMYPAICAECGKATTVPFKPSADKPVYCRNCYQPKRR